MIPHQRVLCNFLFVSLICLWISVSFMPMRLKYAKPGLNKKQCPGFWAWTPENGLWRLLARLYIRWFELIHKPIIADKTESERRGNLDFNQENDKKPSKHRVSIIVAVYNAYDEVKNCIESIVCKTQYPYRLLIIDDASTDPRIHPLLQAYAAAFPHISVEFNNRNLGYTAVINKGIELAAPDDVVLLNSDTQVTEGWLEKLSRCAQDHPATATVTPLSNAAGVFSVPCRGIENRMPDALSIDQMGKLVERLSMGLRPKAPTGCGYCMYVTRSSINAVGGFDEKKFPAGYGEENDFCMRASRKGFVHLIEDATFIYHQRSASFGRRKKKIVSKGMARLRRLHPEYRYLVYKWLITDPLGEFRKRLRDALGKDEYMM